MKLVKVLCCIFLFFLFDLTMHKKYREFKHVRFPDADSNWKKTFRVLGPYCLPDFYPTHLLWRKGT